MQQSIQAHVEVILLSTNLLGRESSASELILAYALSCPTRQHVVSVGDGFGFVTSCGTTTVQFCGGRTIHNNFFFTVVPNRRKLVSTAANYLGIFVRCTSTGY